MAIQMTMVADRVRIRRFVMKRCPVSYGARRAGLEESLGAQAQDQQDEEHSCHDLKTRVDVQVEQLLADSQGQAASDGSPYAAEPTDGKRQEAFQGEVQADGRIRERDRRDHV